MGSPPKLIDGAVENRNPFRYQLTDDALVLVLVKVKNEEGEGMMESSDGVKLADTPQLFNGWAERGPADIDKGRAVVWSEGKVCRLLGCCCRCHWMARHWRLS
jgi:hypothetical protein